MKTLVLNKNSWHYRIASQMGSYDCYGDNHNICAYTKDVIIGLFLLFIIGILIGMLGFVVWHIIFGIIFSIMCGAWMFSAFAEATMVMLLILSFGYSINRGIERFNKWKWSKTNPAYKRPDNFITNAYKSLKGKYCVPITFQE
jgi:hypothetical protein